jgi:PIN domain nuclease of toxin-antitoxin system
LSGYLLDTNIVLTAMDTPEELSAAVQAAIEIGPAYLSLIAYWEVMIKSTKGSLDVGDPRLWWEEALKTLALHPLPLRAEHIHEIYNLPPIHRDPFDRALIAQATVEEMTLVTTDDVVRSYAWERFHVI